MGRLGVHFTRDGKEHWFRGQIAPNKKHVMKSTSGRWMDLSLADPELSWTIERVQRNGEHIAPEVEECGVLSLAAVDEQCKREIGLNHMLWTSASGQYAIVLDAIPSAEGWSIRLAEAHLHLGDNSEFE